jgi:hypothetical protein
MDGDCKDLESMDDILGVRHNDTKVAVGATATFRMYSACIGIHFLAELLEVGRIRFARYVGDNRVGECELCGGFRHGFLVLFWPKEAWFVGANETNTQGVGNCAWLESWKL